MKEKGVDVDQEVEALRAEVREFLARELTADLKQAAQNWYSVPREEGARWHRKLYEQGWIAPSWPVEYGGTGWSLAQKHMFHEELALAGAPDISPFSIGMVGPVIYTFGTDQQKAQHLPGILDGSVWWCQGYSEPGSGSDLASLKTRAVRDGEDYVVNGQKIWTSSAHKSDWIFVLVRTNAEGKKQQGISFLLVPITSPGIEVRPIVTIDGMHSLNEVYFTDVRVPVSNRIGEENKGWTYAKFLLGHERTGATGVGQSRRRIQLLRELAEREAGIDCGMLADDFAFMTKLNQAEVRLEALAHTESRALAAMDSGGNAGNAASMLKQLGTELQQLLSTLRVEAVGYYSLPFEVDVIAGEVDKPSVGPNYALRAVSTYNFERAMTIAGGSSEVQRDVMAKQVLGL